MDKLLIQLQSITLLYVGAQGQLLKQLCGLVNDLHETTASSHQDWFDLWTLVTNETGVNCEILQTWTK